MSKIWPFDIERRPAGVWFTVSLPVGARVLSVGRVNGTLRIFALVETANAHNTEPRRFQLVPGYHYREDAADDIPFRYHCSFDPDGDAKETSHLIEAVEPG